MNLIRICKVAAFIELKFKIETAKATRTEYPHSQ
jgi:hypothetical protein